MAKSSGSALRMVSPPNLEKRWYDVNDHVRDTSDMRTEKTCLDSGVPVPFGDNDRMDPRVASFT